MSESVFMLTFSGLYFPRYRSEFILNIGLIAL